MSYSYDLDITLAFLGLTFKGPTSEEKGMPLYIGVASSLCNLPVWGVVHF